MQFSTSNLSLLTDHIFWKYDGSVKERPEYFVVQHAHRPEYIWGNCLVLKEAPDINVLNRLIENFSKEFPGQNISTAAICWSSGDAHRPMALFDRLPSGARLRITTAMSASDVTLPPYVLSNTDIRRISSDAQWDDLVRAKLRSAPDAYPQEIYSSYLRMQLRMYRAMCDQKLGCWYALYEGGELVSNLGIFGVNGLGRFQMVDTIPEARGNGYCQTLVYFAAKEYLPRVDTLVIVADTSGAAGRIYQKIGFEVRDYLAELEVKCPNECPK